MLLFPLILEHLILYSEGSSFHLGEFIPLLCISFPFHSSTYHPTAVHLSQRSAFIPLS